jgi:two-component system chemotaxis sensor kinase CheA
MSESSNKFFDEMAEDFFAECDELLGVIKGDLLKLDKSGGKEKAQKSLLEELLRSLHTLKGLAGMIGAEGLMTLTHGIENYLKSVYQEDLLISSADLDILFKSAGMIEKHLESLRYKTAPPEIDEILISISSMYVGDSGKELPVSDDADENSIANENVSSSANHGERIWKFVFHPSKELYDEGININIIRSQLGSLGTILYSLPRTDEDGKISFEFSVSTDKPESEFSQLIMKGISYEPGEISPSEDTREDKSAQGRIQKNIVRVDLAKLENIMRSVGDLVISRSRLNEILKSRTVQNDDENALQEINSFMERQIKSLRMGIMDLRLVSIGESFERLQFAIRDLAGKSKKILKLRMEGQGTQIDKFIMDKMFDPLLHIVRNSISHGIETRGEREAAGKSPEGNLLLKASASGNSVIFEIADDGQGIDRDAVRDKAIRSGIISADTIPDNDLLITIIGTPGFSTREKSDVISGRGIGMDVVLKAVDELRGSIQLETEKGIGTRFLIQLPLTLSIVDALIIKSGNNTFALPMPLVNEIIRFNTDELIRYEGNEMIPYRDFVLPIIRLDEFFGYTQARNGQADAIVTGTGRSTAGIMIDSIIGQREIVVRSLSDPLVKVEGISGATDLGEGRIVLIIDAAEILRASLKKIRSSEKSIVS